MENKLNMFRWLMVTLFILWVGWTGLGNVVFNEPKLVSFEDVEKVLIDQYFDENINETVYVYCFSKGDVVWYNITNHDLNSNIVCTFNSSYTIEPCNNYTRGMAFQCVREKPNRQIKYNVQQRNTPCNMTQYIHNTWNSVLKPMSLNGFY